MYTAMMRPIMLGKVEIKNRIVMAPLSMGLKEDEYIKKIDDIAKSGVGLIIIGDISVKDNNGDLFSNSDEFYKRLLYIIHKHGAKASAQLYSSDYALRGLEDIIPKIKNGELSHSQIRNMMFTNLSKNISSMNVEDIHAIIDYFEQASIRMRELGFDILQIHGDRIIGAFSSFIFNKRNDEYGGNTVRRAKLSFDIVNAVRKANKDIPIDFKLVLRQENPNYGSSGFIINEASIVVPMLTKLGVNSFHVTLSDHSSLDDTIPYSKHEIFHSDGCFLYLADQVKKYTKVPVCGVGHLSNPDYIENAIDSGRIDMASIARQFIADSFWFEKVRKGHINEIKKCIYCNKKCLGAMKKHERVGCIHDV